MCAGGAVRAGRPTGGAAASQSAATMHRATTMAGRAITATIALGVITIVPTGMDRAGIIGNEFLPGASSLDEDGPWELYPKST